MAKRSIIDVHHHVILKHGGPPGAAMPEWTIEADRALMESLDVRGVLLSLPISGTARQVRGINSALADQAAYDPKRYAVLACLPFEDAEAALAEIELAYAKLDAAGFCLPSNHAGMYVGDDRMDPILDELDRRRAVVLVHPQRPAGEAPSFGRPLSLCEFPFDTTRAVIDLVYRGKVERYPHIRWIVSHAGGVIPFLAYRLSTVAAETGAIPLTSEQVRASLRELYYDVALSTSPAVFAALRELVDPTHIVFGTDFPMRGAPGVAESIREIEAEAGLDDAARHTILSGASSALFPRFA